MTLDHINAFLLSRPIPALFAAGRLALPLFAFALGGALALAPEPARDVYPRLILRLAVAGLAATPLFVPLRQLWPANVLFLFLLFVLIVALCEQPNRWGRAAAIPVFVLGGCLVEAQWIGLLTCLGTYTFCKHRTVPTLIVWVGSVGLLQAVNGNAWALAAIPVVYAAALFDFRVPRIKYAFYVYYPAHLAVLLALARATCN